MELQVWVAQSKLSKSLVAKLQLKPSQSFWAAFSYHRDDGWKKHWEQR
jgi:hypothetical protein